MFAIVNVLGQVVPKHCSFMLHHMKKSFRLHNMYVNSGCLCSTVNLKLAKNSASLFCAASAC